MIDGLFVLTFVRLPIGRYRESYAPSPLYARKQTGAVHLPVSTLGHKRKFRSGSIVNLNLLYYIVAEKHANSDPGSNDETIAMAYNTINRDCGI